MPDITSALDSYCRELDRLAGDLDEYGLALLAEAERLNGEAHEAFVNMPSADGEPRRAALNAIFAALSRGYGVLWALEAWSTSYRHGELSDE